MVKSLKKLATYAVLRSYKVDRESLQDIWSLVNVDVADYIRREMRRHRNKLSYVGKLGMKLQYDNGERYISSAGISDSGNLAAILTPKRLYCITPYQTYIDEHEKCDEFPMSLRVAVSLDIERYSITRVSPDGNHIIVMREALPPDSRFERDDWRIKVISILWKDGEIRNTTEWKEIAVIGEYISVKWVNNTSFLIAFQYSKMLKISLDDDEKTIEIERIQLYEKFGSRCPRKMYIDKREYIFLHWDGEKSEDGATIVNYSNETMRSLGEGGSTIIRKIVSQSSPLDVYTDESARFVVCTRRYGGWLWLYDAKREEERYKIKVGRFGIDGRFQLASNSIMWFSTAHGAIYFNVYNMSSGQYMKELINIEGCCSPEMMIVSENLEFVLLISHNGYDDAQYGFIVAKLTYRYNEDTP